MTFYSVLERNELSSHDKTQRNFKYILLSEINLSETITYCMIPTVWHCGKGKPMETVRFIHVGGVQFSCSVMSDAVRPHGLQQTRLPCPSASPRACPNSCPRSQRCHPTISSSCPLLLPSIFPSIRVFSDESILRINMDKVLELQLQHQSFQWIFRTDFLYNSLVWSPCSTRECIHNSIFRVVKIQCIIV